MVGVTSRTVRLTREKCTSWKKMHTLLKHGFVIVLYSYMVYSIFFFCQIGLEQKLNKQLNNKLCGNTLFR